MDRRMRLAYFLFAPRAVEYIFAMLAFLWGLSNLVLGFRGFDIINPTGSTKSFYGISGSAVIFLPLWPLLLGGAAMLATATRRWKLRCWLALALSFSWFILAGHYLRYPPQAGGAVSYAFDALVELWVWARVLIRADELR
jgi:hypothetical protein